MASNLYRTRGMIQFPRFVPTLIARAQASQNSPTPPTPGPVCNQFYVLYKKNIYLRVYRCQVVQKLFHK